MHTHMPFLFPGGLLLAGGDARRGGGAARWKLHVGATPDDARPLATGLPESTVECSPALARHAEGVEVAFIGQAGGVCRFYAMRGRDIHHLSQAIPMEILGHVGAHAGTRSAAFAAVDRPEVAGVAVAAFRSEEPAIIPYAILGLDAVARLAFDHAHPWRMLASGPAGGEWHTTLYDLKTEEARRVVLANGSGVYKASLLGDRLAYAARLSEEFEAREIRFAESGEWRLAPLPASPAFHAAQRSPATTTTTAERIRTRREKTLRANCAVGSFCRTCRRHIETRADLETLGLVGREGNGCPRGLPWNVSDAALAAVRPLVPGGAETAVWCERFMVGTTPAQCQRCIETRIAGDADAAARWLQGMADARTTFSCASRQKTDARRLQECCGRAEREVAVYACTRKGTEAMPADCAACVDRVPAAPVEPGMEATPC